MKKMVKDTQENRKKCICSGCPTYPESCKGEVLYCAVGKSSCDTFAKGCICDSCPVYFENRLNSLYFCDKEEVAESGIYMRKKRSGEDIKFYESVCNIKEIASTGKSIVRAMGSMKKISISFDDLNFIPAQVHKMPLNAEEKVSLEVIMGPKARKPLRISSPIMISGMSFGSVSKKTRIVIASVARDLNIGFNTGEGGIIEDELDLASKCIIGQYATGRFGTSENVLKRVAAVEIRFGQGAYPGKGSYLPTDKITPEIAKARNLKPGEASYSPARHIDINNFEDLKKKISYLRKLTDGVPIGAKIGCGNIERDVDILARSGVDFIALDGFAGGTGATNYFVRENVGIPIMAALPRAYGYLKKLGVKGGITLVAGGGLRTSADFAKCLALGADAVYIGTAALIAINCEQYRICQTGHCPTGVATHNKSLISQLDVENGIQKLKNFISVSNEEIASFARIVGKDKVKNLVSEDLIALTKDASSATGISWINNEKY